MFMGIDGGGSTIRAALTNAEGTILSEVTLAGSSNPSVIGWDAAAARVTEAIQAVLTQAQTSPEQVRAVAAGLAGAAAEHASEWVESVLRGALPHSTVVASGDLEIALVGAHGARRGVIVVAGTGSAAYGVDANGKSLLVGGWGYLLGDEGGGYWIGLQALKALAKVYDGALETDQGKMLAQYVGEMLELQYPKDLLKWLYKSEPPTRDVARLAEVVFHAFAEGDQLADSIIQHATWALGDLVKLVSGRLMLEKPDVAFAGSLLTQDTPLRTRLAKHLGLASAPLPLYPPVVGAALLAIHATGDGLPPAQSTGEPDAD